MFVEKKEGKDERKGVASFVMTFVTLLNVSATVAVFD